MEDLTLCQLRGTPTCCGRLLCLKSLLYLPKSLVELNSILLNVTPAILKNFHILILSENETEAQY
jgi:hypothetical protein